ncbi:MAG: hypothetical protein CM15mP85_06590 [Rhodobacterales bacterium]|nr:MAG: hypothetical protein CM15mP85_06590 [Rhodobacterales bacterium]
MLGSKSIISFEDARAKAKRKLPRMIFDFIEGSAGREIASDRNSEIFNDIFLKSKVLAEIKDPKLNSKFLNYSFDFPFGIAPMGMCDLAWPGADKNLAETAKNLIFRFVFRLLPLQVSKILKNGGKIKLGFNYTSTDQLKTLGR